jgi:hypothetical protein
VNSLKYEAPKKKGSNEGGMDTCLNGHKFPEVRLRGNQVKALAGSMKAEAGQVYEGTFQFKVGGWTEPEDTESGEPSMTIRLIACDSVEDAEETDESPADTDEEA